MIDRSRADRPGARRSPPSLGAKGFRTRARTAAALAAGWLLALTGCTQAPPPAPGALPAGGSAPATVPVSSIPTGTQPGGAPAIGPGRADISGTVEGPDGPVAGATVEVERLLGGNAVQVLVTSGPGGGWQLSGVLGGRYSIRAWLAPSLAQPSPASFFLVDGSTRSVTLVVQSFAAPLVQSAIAPYSPVVGEPSQLIVQVSALRVQSDGTVVNRPEAGVSVQLGGSGGWDVTPPDPATTDSKGQVSWLLTCTSAGNQPLEAYVGAASAASTGGAGGSPPGAAGPLALTSPFCVPPPVQFGGGG